MIKYTFYIFMTASILLVSCVDRKTSDSNEVQNGQKVVRLEDKTTQKIPGSDTTNPSLSADDNAAIADAKGVINDYYNAFERKSPREAYDMWAPKNTPTDYAKFAEENPNYEKITVAFAQGAQSKKMGDDTQVTLPIRVSATNKEGDVVNSSGSVTLTKKDEKNSSYQITAMDVKKEAS